jgi:hypothetical protein
MLVLLAKTVGVTGHSSLSPLSAAINLVIFSSLLFTHFFTAVFFDERVNRLYAGLYLVLLYGAMCRLATFAHYPTQLGVKDTPLPYYCYFIGLPFVLALGCLGQYLSLRSSRLIFWRYSVNRTLITKLRWLVRVVCLTIITTHTGGPNNLSTLCASTGLGR